MDIAPQFPHILPTEKPRQTMRKSAREDLREIMKKTKREIMRQNNTATSPVTDPVGNSRKVDRYALVAEEVFVWTAVIITSAGFFVFGKGTAAQYTDDPRIQIFAGLLAAAVAGFVTDLAFRRFLEEVMFQILSAPLRRRSGGARAHGYIRFLRAFRLVILTVIVAGLFVADFYSVYVVKDPLADSAKQATLRDVDTERAEMASVSDSRTAPLQARLVALKKDIAATERKVERDNPGLRKLIREKQNAWATQELARKKDRATKPLRAELAKTEQSLTAALSHGIEQDSAATALLLADNQHIMQANQRKRDALSGLFFGFGFGSKLGAVVIRIFLVVTFLAKFPHLVDVNGDGVVDGQDVTDAARGNGGYAAQQGGQDASFA